MESDEAKLARMIDWYNALHYAVRKDANILDHKMTEAEAHEAAMKRAAWLHSQLEQLYEENKILRAKQG